MLDLFKEKKNADGDNPVILPGYHQAPSNYEFENLKTYRSVLAAGPGHVSGAPGFRKLFGYFGNAVSIRPYRARTPSTMNPPYFFPHGSQHNFEGQ